MRLLVFDVDHLIAVLTLSDVSAAVSLMEVDSVLGEKFHAIFALLILELGFHVIQMQLTVYLISNRPT